ncbi:hypothetical protein GBA52_022750 [Prunus armeniaca]|nr:hypothetical protein GBA52_022750 [Prunus armeniaca]
MDILRDVLPVWMAYRRMREWKFQDRRALSSFAFPRARHENKVCFFNSFIKKQELYFVQNYVFVSLSLSQSNLQRPCLSVLNFFNNPNLLFSEFKGQKQLLSSVDGMGCSEKQMHRNKTG